MERSLVIARQEEGDQAYVKNKVAKSSEELGTTKVVIE